jgi:hypothetical protein
MRTSLSRKRDTFMRTGIFDQKYFVGLPRHPGAHKNAACAREIAENSPG